jgi:predicted RNase H-like HicB family nuclease
MTGLEMEGDYQQSIMYLNMLEDLGKKQPRLVVEEKTDAIPTSFLFPYQQEQTEGFEHRKELFQHLFSLLLREFISKRSLSYFAPIEKALQEIRELRRIIESKLSNIKDAQVLQINRLSSKHLSQPISVLIEDDKEGFLARTPDLPLYGYGEDRLEAIEMLKREIESLYNDLMEDDSFSEEYSKIKEFLINRIVD